MLLATKLQNLVYLLEHKITWKFFTEFRAISSVIVCKAVKFISHT